MEEQSPDYTRVSTQPPTISQMMKQKHQDHSQDSPHAQHRHRTHQTTVGSPNTRVSSTRLTVKLTQEQAAMSYQPTELNNYLVRND